MYNHSINSSFVSPCLQHLRANKAGFNLKIVHFYIRRKLLNYDAVNNYHRIKNMSYVCIYAKINVVLYWYIGTPTFFSLHFNATNGC